MFTTIEPELIRSPCFLGGAFWGSLDRIPGKVVFPTLKHEGLYPQEGEHARCIWVPVSRKNVRGPLLAPHTVSKIVPKR